MKLGCINSCWFGSNIDYFTGIRQIKEIGYDTIDIFPVFSFKSYDLKQIKKLCDSLKMPIRSMVSAYPEMIALEEHVRQYAIDSYKKLLDMGVYLDAQNLLIVLGEYIWEKNVIAPAVQWGYAVHAARELSDYAAKCDMNVLVELEPFEYSLVNDIETMLAFLEEVDRPNCLANVDIGHLHVRHIPPEQIARLAGRIGGVHLSDNDGTVHNDWPTGRGNADIVGYLLALQAVGYDDVISVELEFAPDPDGIVEWVADCYTETTKIMDRLGIRA
jgi:sugar phosphate isomerase/epimerase